MVTFEGSDRLMIVKWLSSFEVMIACGFPDTEKVTESLGPSSFVNPFEPSVSESTATIAVGSFMLTSWNPSSSYDVTRE